ncbi:MAG: RsmB/NOP family class I SAM-dependent RNA methyltransferase [Alphaproteobacteria bacterium]|nr:RsmB/NOP family class I SAM-dependent RNA methyltransferase [Alphaproteobacteria bacterium]
MNSPDLLTRHLAVEIFDAVIRNGKGLEEEYACRIERFEKKQPLETRDRTFIRLLVTVMLRRLGQIDNIISHFLKKPLPDHASYVQDILRISTVQLVFLDTPAHAAVSTGVSLVKSDRKYFGFAGLTNAVLRRIAKEGKAIHEQQNEAELNIPVWLFDKWVKEYGLTTAKKIAAAGLKEAPLDFSVKSDPEIWAQKLEAVLMPTGSLRREKQASVPQLPGYEEGAWWIQDLSAAVPAQLFHGLKGKRAIDICAAPGGKTAQMILAGAQVTAVDVSEKRIKRLKENLDRLGISAETVCDDIQQWWEKNHQTIPKFDAVLLDAPCSATGTLRRHPDVIRHRTPQDIVRLSTTQKQLLKTAVQMMADGAELIYCVCSVLPEEGRLIINDAVQSGLVERITLNSTEIPQEMITKDGDMLILPFFYEENGGCDGFYASRLRKKEKKN